MNEETKTILYTVDLLEYIYKTPYILLQIILAIPINFLYRKIAKNKHRILIAKIYIENSSDVV